jgi:hypothetical protein
MNLGFRNSELWQSPEHSAIPDRPYIRDEAAGIERHVSQT